jgi:hypothetical protein
VIMRLVETFEAVRALKVGARPWERTRQKQIRLRPCDCQCFRLLIPMWIDEGSMPQLQP